MKKMTKKTNKDQVRKSTVKFKRKRAQIRSKCASSTARKESREGITYQSGVGLNLDPNTIITPTSKPTSVTDSVKLFQIQEISISQFKEIEHLVPPCTYQPKAEKVHFDENKYYNFLVFDIETNTMGKSAEICQLAVTDKFGSNTFSEYIVPTHDIDFHASNVNKLQVLNVNGQRRLLKNGQVISTVDLSQALDNFLNYVSESINRAKATTNKEIYTILTGHNVSTFDTPIILRNADEQFAAKLQSMDVWFADSIPLFKNLTKVKYPLLKNDDGSFPKMNQSAIYESLFQESFHAHDALEDVLALRKILFDSKLNLSPKSIIENSSPVNVRHAVEDMNYLDHRHNLVQTFKDILFTTGNKGPIKRGMVEKIAGSGLSYTDLKKTYVRFGAEGLVALLSKPASSASSSTPRVTRTDRILAAIVQHFKDTV